MPVRLAGGPSARVGAAARGAVPLFVVLVTGVSVVLLGAGAVLALVAPGLLAGGGQALGRSRVFEDYTASRDGALAVFLLVPLLRRSTAVLRWTLLLVVCVQILDAVLDVSEGRWSIVPVAIAVAGACFLSAMRLRQGEVGG